MMSEENAKKRSRKRQLHAENTTDALQKPAKARSNRLKKSETKAAQEGAGSLDRTRNPPDDTRASIEVNIRDDKNIQPVDKSDPAQRSFSKNTAAGEVTKATLAASMQAFVESIYTDERDLDSARKFWNTLLDNTSGSNSVARILEAFIIRSRVSDGSGQTQRSAAQPNQFAQLLDSFASQAFGSGMGDQVPASQQPSQKPSDAPPEAFRPAVLPGDIADLSTRIAATPESPPPKRGSTRPAVSVASGSSVRDLNLAEQGRQLSNAIADMFGENPRLYSRGIPGDTVEVQLKLRRVVEQIKNRPEAIVVLMRAVIPATLRRLTKENNLTPETAVDIITLTIGDLRPKRQSEPEDSEMLRFFAAARSLLERQKVGITASERGGYYATRNAIAQYISSGRPSQRVLIVAVFYFEEILFEYYLQMLENPEFRLSKRCRRSLEVAGNNCGNHLDDLRVPGSDENRLNSLWATISGITVAVAVEENRQELNAGEVATIQLCLETCFGRFNPNSLESGTLVAVDVMMYGPGAWRSEFVSEQMLGLMLSAGLIRLARPSRHEDAVSPIFNAGVELLRLGEQFNDPRRLVWQRLLVNAAGLWWSLKLVPDLHTALTKFHGLDCLVNLWGAVSDVKSELQSQADQFYQACLALFQWTKIAQEKVPEQLADVERIRRSFAILGSVFDGNAQPRSVISDGFAPLEQLCRYAITRFAPGAEIPDLSATGSAAEARETSLRATATYLGLLFASLKSDVVKFDEIIVKVNRFVPEEGHTEERILERMKEIWGDWGASRELSAESSVLAQTGIVNANDFEKLHQDARDDDAVENYAFVENCEYSWLLI